MYESYDYQKQKRDACEHLFFVLIWPYIPGDS